MAQEKSANIAKKRVDVVTLANAHVLDSENNKIKLGQFWQSQTAILVFLRHFACIACRAHATEVWRDREKYEKTGARLVFVGNGAPNYIDIFKSELGLSSATIVTDPSLEVFGAAGFRRGFFEVVQLRSLLNAVKLAGQGNSQKSTQAQGSHLQLGGVIAMSKEGRVLYHFVSQALGDFPAQHDIEVVLSAESATFRMENELLKTGFRRNQ